MHKIEPQAWIHGADWKWWGWKSWEEGGGTRQEHVWMTHGHGQQCGNWLWGARWVKKGKGGKVETTVIE